MSKDFDLLLFSHAMEILVNASQLKLDPFNKSQSVSSIGVDGYGNIDTLDKLAGAMNFKGYRTKQGKFLKGSNLKQMKYNLTKRYGHEFVTGIVSWENVSTEIVA